MPFTAVISATLPAGNDPQVLRGKLNFAGQALFEYQVRQAAEAGAAHVVVLVANVTPDMSRAVDRLSNDGISVAMVRDQVALAREIGADGEILLVADGAVIGQPYFAAMAAREGAAVLVVDDSATAAAFERIDANHRWAGLARLTSVMVHNTLDMLGDWDLQSTLVRQAVQASAPRILVPAHAVTDGDVALVENQQGADFIASNLSFARPGTGDGAHSGLVENFLIEPVAAAIAPLLLRKQVTPAPVQVAAMATSVIGLSAAQLGWPVLALALFFLSLLAESVARELGRLARRPLLDGWRAWFATGVILAGLIIIGGSVPELKFTGVLGGVWLAALLLIVEISVRKSGIITPKLPWLLSTGMAVLIVFFGHLSGFSHLSLILAITWGLAGAGYLALRNIVR